MRKQIVMVFCVTSMLLFCGNASLAQDNEGRFGVGARAAFVDYSNDDRTFSGVGEVELEPDDAVMYEVNLTYFPHEYFSLELGVDYVETDVDVNGVGISGDGGEMEQVPVLLTGRFHFSTNPKVTPYLGVGIGYYFNDFDSNRDSPDVEVDDSIGFHVNGGIEVFVADDAAINLDIKYIWNEIDVDLPGSSDEEFYLNQFVTGIGFKYYF